MKFTYSLFILFAIFIGELFSQPTTFLKSYNTGNSGYSVREVSGNSFIVAGCTDFYYNFHWFTMSPIASTNIELIKTDLDGNLSWEKIYNMSGFRTLATWMEPVENDGFILAGRSNKDNTWPPDSNDILLIKTDTSGNIQWSKKYDTGKDELGYCVRTTFDGGFIVSGFHDAVPMSLTVNTYAILIKTDHLGNIQWEKKYQLAVRDLDTGESFPWAVRQTADSGYVLVGTTVGSHAADLYVIRVNQTGDVLWAKSYEHDFSMLRFSVGLDIIESLSGDFVIAGSLDKDQSLTQYNYPYILKIRSSGDLLDAKFYDSNPAQTFQSGFSAVQQTPDGGYFFTGMGGYGGFGMQAQLLKTDEALNMQWSRAYSNDGVATIGSRSGCFTSDGGYIFTGKKLFAGTILLKTDNFGFVPCKNPGELIELHPSIIVQSRFPLSFSGINVSDVLFTQQLHLTDTSTVCPVALAVLPVELISFSVSALPNHQVQLQWQTASETNNDYFIVSSSTDGKTFSQTAIVKGGGNITSISNYELLDEHPEFAPILYYRLEQVDYDGTHRISKMLSLKMDNDELRIISIHADHNSSSITVQLANNSRGNVICNITDVLGKKSNQPFAISEPGVHLIVLDAKTLSRGIYFILLSDGDHFLTRKFIY